MHKLCSRCGIEKPLEAFAKDASRKDGYRYWCRVCQAGYAKQRRQDDPEKCSGWYRTNPQKAIAAINRWAAAHPDYRRAKHRRWETKNPEKMRAKKARRRAAKLKRTPRWADLEKIKQIYVACPKGMTVDHIVPLQGELVSGLHVENNLRYIAPRENSSKGNKFDPMRYNGFKN